MISVNYQKRKNTELFKSLEDPELLFLSNSQNYIPIYTKFFSLNESNYNNINLNHKWYITSINNSNDDTNLYSCKIKNTINNKTKDKNVFFKMAPLLDPYKYLIGKYNVTDEKLFSLPKIDSTENECHQKFIDINNSAYVDGFFLYLTSTLLNNHVFLHGVDYYGSFLGIKNDFVINIFDDIDYLNNSEFFNKNKNILFKIDDYEHLFQNEIQKLKPIIIEHNTSVKSQLSIKSFDNEIFEEIFEEKSNDNNVLNNNFTDLVDVVDISNSNILDKEFTQNVTLNSNSTCSSRSSYTNDNDIEEDFEEDVENSNDIENKDEKKSENEVESESESESSEEEEEIIEAIIPKFPVQVIGMEYCENTFDDLILSEELSSEEWLSSFMQIIMILITYQKVFNFTHNDLHTNNVMYNKTDKKFLYYCYKKKNYKVPTFGRIFKIIDFGRSIYKFDGKLFCSDSFQIGGDAATQYNTEPYLNEKKTKIRTKL
jgi:hypothetical protein